MASIDWDGGGDGNNWSDRFNWQGDVLPGASDDVVIGAAFAGTTVRSTTNVTINSFMIDASLTIESGQMVVAADSVMNGDILTLNSSLSGLGDLTVTKVMNWTGGSLGANAAQGETTIAATGTLNLTGSANKLLHNRTLNNLGTTILAGGGHFGLSHTSLLNNQVGAVFDVQSDSDLTFSLGVINNAGSFRKSGGGINETTIDVEFNNSGTLVVQTGRLRLNRDGTSSGAFIAEENASIVFSAGYTLAAGAYVAGTGTYELRAGDLTVSSNLVVDTSFNLIGGAIAGGGQVSFRDSLNWTGGAMRGGGVTEIAPTATLVINSATGVSMSPRTLINRGTTILTGTGHLSVSLGSTFTNAVDALFEVRSDADISGGGAGTNVFQNAGILRKTAGNGETKITSTHGRFDNSGSVEVLTGRVTIDLGGTSSGPFMAAENTKILFDAGYTLTSGASLAGTGTYELTSGELAINTNLVVNTAFHFSGGVIAGSSTVIFGGSLNWTGGEMRGGGVTGVKQRCQGAPA